MFNKDCSYNSLHIHNAIFNGNTEVALQIYSNVNFKVKWVDIRKKKKSFLEIISMLDIIIIA